MTERNSRQYLPMPTTVTDKEARESGIGGQIQALDAIYDAYMALNAAGGQFAWDNGPRSPMATIAKGAKVALARLPGVSPHAAAVIWDAMTDGASGAQWAYDLWRKGEI